MTEVVEGFAAVVLRNCGLEEQTGDTEIVGIHVYVKSIEYSFELSNITLCIILYQRYLRYM